VPTSGIRTRRPRDNAREKNPTRAIRLRKVLNQSLNRVNRRMQTVLRAAVGVADDRGRERSDRVNDPVKNPTNDRVSDRPSDQKAACQYTEPAVRPRTRMSPGLKKNPPRNCVAKSKAENPRDRADDVGVAVARPIVGPGENHRTKRR
jgi:hypothetical protein